MAVLLAARRWTYLIWVTPRAFGLGRLPTWVGWYRTGMRARRRRRPLHAAAYLARAARLCPPHRSAALARILTALGRSCVALDDRETAVRCLEAAKRTHSGISRSALLAACGEPDTSNQEWRVFYSRQLALYLRYTGKNVPSRPEADMLGDLLCDEYRSLVGEAERRQLSATERSRLLHRHRTLFPLPLPPTDARPRLD